MKKQEMVTNVKTVRCEATQAGNGISSLRCRDLWEMEVLVVQCGGCESSV